MATRAKKQVTELLDRAGAEKVLKQYANATSEIKEIEAKNEILIQAVREKSASDLLTHSQAQRDALDKLQYYAEFNREGIFKNKKSIDMVHGRIGFRIGTYKVKAIGTTLAKAFEAVKMANLKFIRIKEELDKDKIINSREDAVLMSKLKAIGLEVDQDETFFVEVKDEQVD